MTQNNLARTSNGRFAKGNSGGPGAPNAYRISVFRQTLLASVKEKDIKEIVKTLIEKSKKGDTKAIQLLLSYTVGAPKEFDVNDNPESYLTKSSLLEGIAYNDPELVRVRTVLFERIKEKALERLKNNTLPE